MPHLMEHLSSFTEDEKKCLFAAMSSIGLSPGHMAFYTLSQLTKKLGKLQWKQTYGNSSIQVWAPWCKLYDLAVKLEDCGVDTIKLLEDYGGDKSHKSK